MNKDVLDLSGRELLDAYQKKSLSPVEVSRAALQRALDLNPSLNAMVLISDEDSLMKQAHISEGRWARGEPCGILEGIPVTIKDGTNVIGWPTRDGSLTTSDMPQQEDSPVPARLRESGVIFLGKTTTPEFGHKGVTDSPVSGITRNPWNLSKTSGGSSGGAAVAAATGMGYLHHGTDGGGSVRIPANFCGVFGIKPSGGLVPGWPPTLFSTIAAAGPITRTVEDAALMLDVMSRPDSRDWHSVPYQERHFASSLSKPVNGLKIAYASTISGVKVDAEVMDIVAKAARGMDGKIGNVEEITLDFPTIVDTFNKHWMAIAAWIVNQMPEDKRSRMDPYLLGWARRGAGMKLDDYLNAEHERMMIGHRLKMLFEAYDILVLPVTPVVAFNVGKNVADDEEGRPWDDWTPFTLAANLGKLPAASVPCGMTREGLPVGIQVVSGFLKDGLVLQVSQFLEQEICFQGWRLPQSENKKAAVQG